MVASFHEMALKEKWTFSNLPFFINRDQDSDNLLWKCRTKITWNLEQLTDLKIDYKVISNIFAFHIYHSNKTAKHLLFAWLVQISLGFRALIEKNKTKTICK